MIREPGSTLSTRKVRRLAALAFSSTHSRARPKPRSSSSTAPANKTLPSAQTRNQEQIFNGKPVLQFDNEFDRRNFLRTALIVGVGAGFAGHAPGDPTSASRASAFAGNLAAKSLKGDLARSSRSWPAAPRRREATRQSPCSATDRRCQRNAGPTTPDIAPDLAIGGDAVVTPGARPGQRGTGRPPPASTLTASTSGSASSHPTRA